MKTPPQTAPEACGKITGVAAGSLAARAGLRAGDCLVEVNGLRVRDVIDVQYAAAEEWVEFVVWRDGRLLRKEAERRYGEEIGLSFADDLFDGLRQCNNHCPFCFVKQLPAGLRPSLYIQDDDYRLSFLQGSFVTLTNLTEEDWERLEEQRLSPLYVSVHATQEEARRRLLGRRDAPPIMAQLRRLIELDITVHTQIVVVPGVNDGDVLAQSLEDLAGLYPGAASIGVVPVGLTRFSRPALRRPTAEEAAAVLELVERFQALCRRRYGVNLAYASDEWYLMAGRDIPPAAAYDDFPQVENGIGLVRLFLDDWAEVRDALHPPAGTAPVIGCVTGRLFAPVLAPVLEEFARRTAVPVRLIEVENGLLGEAVTVAGLLSGADVVRAYRAAGGGATLVALPRRMFDAQGAYTIDDWTPARLAQELGAEVCMVDSMRELAERLR
jgi:putative radical SAM enzyme (TIGR03279 family)